LPVLAGFLFDWLIASGRIDGTASGLTDRLTQLDAWLQRLVLPLLRPLLLIALLAGAAQHPPLASLFTVLPALAGGTLQLATSALLFALAFHLLLAGTVIGYLGRACATGLMLLLCWQYPFNQWDASA